LHKILKNSLKIFFFKRQTKIFSAFFKVIIDRQIETTSLHIKFSSFIRSSSASIILAGMMAPKRLSQLQRKFSIGC
uniref:Ovule protein n=1 Tax=Ascaris lumbricoides TaxID=6252 RepID=A0A0M3I9Q2_ASCLU